jgi:WD40 repeat protein
VSGRPGSDEPAHLVDAQGSQGVQIGKHNKQVNKFIQTNVETLIVQAAPAAGEVSRPFTAPGLPPHFLPRPTELERIIEHLFDADRARPRPGVVVVHGGGGFGKTTMAAAVCHDERVRAAFGDGVLWLQFAETTTRDGALALLHDQIGLLDPQAHAANDVGAASAQLRALLAGRAVLLVLDDVWSPSLLPYFIDDGTTCLITTRLEAVLNRAGGQRVPVGELAAGQAAELLERWLPEVPDATERALLARLGDRLGDWALMLELVGAELRSLVDAGRTTAEAVAHVDRRLARDIAYLDRSDEGRSSAISSSLDASVSLLPSDHRARFAELAVFPAGAEIPFDTVARLWAATAGYDEIAAEDALEAMYRLALFSRYDVRRRLLRLHDIVRQLIVGRAGDIAVLHQALVDSWDDPRQPPDTYAWTYLLYHLHELGRTDEIQSLLSDFDWVYRRLRATTPAVLIAGFTEHCPGREGGLITAALRMAGPALSDPAQLAAQLVGRLADVAPDLPMIERLLEAARHYEAEPSLLPDRVRLLPADRGVHTRINVGSPILAAALTGDGTHLTAGQYDGTVSVWDWRRHERIAVVACGVGPVWSLAVRGDLVAVGGRYGYGANYPRPQAPVQVWNWRTGEHLCDLGRDLPDVSEGYYTHLSGALVAVTNGEVNNRIEILDWVAQQPVRTLEEELSGAGNRPQPVFLAPPYLLYHDGSSRWTDVWDIRSWDYLGATNGQVGDESVPFAVDGSLYVRERWLGVGRDFPSLAFRRDKDTPNERYPSADQACDIWGYGAVVSAAVERQGHILIASDVIDAYGRLDGPVLGRLEGHSSLITSILTAGDDLATTSYDGTIRIWDGQRLQEDLAARRAGPAGDLGHFYQPAISALDVAGDAVFVGTMRGRIEEWDPSTAAVRVSTSVGWPVRALAANARWVVYSAFDRAKDTQFAVRHRDRWADPADSPRRPPERVGGPGSAGIVPEVEAVVVVRLCGDSCAAVVRPYYTPANSLGIGDYTGNRICVIDLSRDETELVVGEWISAVDLSSDLIAGASRDGTVSIWQRSDGALLNRFPAHEGGVHDLRIGGGLLYSSGADRIVRSWELPSGSARRTFGPFTGTVTGLHVSEDLLVTAGEDQSVTVFDRHDGRELLRFDDDVAVTRAAVLGDDLATIVSGGDSGFLQVLRANEPLRALLRPSTNS